MPIKVDSRTGKEYFMLEGVRLSYPSLFEKTQVSGQGEAKFRASYITAKNDPQIKELVTFIKKVAQAMWPQKFEAIISSIKNNPNKFPLVRDGDLKDDPNYEGMYFGGCSAKTRPLVVDIDGRTPLTSDDNKPYAGCYVDLSFDVFASNNQGPGIYGGLRGVRFRKDGDAFGGGLGASESEFDDVSDKGESSSGDGLGL